MSALLRPGRIAVSLALVAMCSVHLGMAVSIGLVQQIGAEGVVALRLLWAAIILVALARPWRATMNRSALWTCILLGMTMVGMATLFTAALTRLPMGTASALEFLGPLGIAVSRGRGSARLWSLVAAAGVLLLTEPWQGSADLVGVLFALGGAVCWAAYILLAQRAGDQVTGLTALAISVPVAAIASVPVTAIAAATTAGPSIIGHIDWQLIGVGFVLALLLPVIPFSLELVSLRHLTAASFGTLVSLEPAIAAVIGFAALGQVPSMTGTAGILLVVAAGIGATRTGARGDESNPDADKPTTSRPQTDDEQNVAELS